MSFSPEASLLVRGLLQLDPTRRLGTMARGIRDLKGAAVEGTREGLSLAVQSTRFLRQPTGSKCWRAQRWVRCRR